MAQSWSNLCSDIVALVINRLSYKESIRFRAVCKNWRDIADAADVHSFVKKAEKLPWIMAYNSSSCFLYDPSHKRQYTVFSNDKSREKTFSGTQVCDSKNDWVLFSQRTTSSVFFYNPFTDKIIQLPKLDLTHHRATLSTSPISPDCVVFLVRDKIQGYMDFSICLCKPGYKKWRKLFFQGDYGDVEDVEYMKGVFYCTFGERGIGAFNRALHEWKLYPFPYRCRLIDEGVTRVWDRLTECNGYLILSHKILAFTLPGTGIIPEFNISRGISWWNFLRLDESKMNWTQVERWDDRSLFLGPVSMSVPVQDEELADTVYFSSNYPF